MWYMVDDVKATTTGPGGHRRHGFDILDSRGRERRTLISLCYKTPEEAQTARELVQQAIAKAIYITGT